MIFEEYRKDKKLTQKDLSKISHVSETTIRNIESEKTEPTTVTFSKLINTLNISDEDAYEYLMSYLDIPEGSKYV